MTHKHSKSAALRDMSDTATGMWVNGEWFTRAALEVAAAEEKAIVKARRKAGHRARTGSTVWC